MLIGIDASRLTEKNRTGTENYLYYVVNCIAKYDMGNKYILYFRDKPTDSFWNNLVCNNINFSYRGMTGLLSWTQVNLAMACVKDCVNVLLSPWHTIPIFHKPSMKIVSVIHGLEYSRMRGGPTIYSILFSDKVIAVSNYTKSEILNSLPIVKKEKIKVIYEGVDTALYYKRSVEEIADVKNKYGISGKYVFYIGTFGLRKNIPKMIQAFGRFVNNYPEFKDLNFVLGGRIPLEYEKIKELPKSLSIEHHVKFLGYVPENDLPALLSGAHALMYVSKSEGFGLPVLESLSCRTRVITANTSATKEVGDGFVYLADPNDIISITDAIYKSFSNDLFFDYDSIESYIRTNFDWSQNSKKLLSELV